jgi:hypothetical protein
MVENYESVSLVAFLTLPPPAVLKLWTVAFDEDPTDFRSMPSGQSFVQSNVDRYTVRLTSQPNRIDLSIAGLASIPPRIPAPDIGKIDQAIAFAQSKMAKLISLLKVGRAAAVIQGYTAVQEQAQTVTVLRSWLPELNIPQAATDLSYSITVPLKSNLNENRTVVQLCRWQSVQMQLLEIPGVGAAQPKATEPVFAAQAYIDVFGKELELLDDDAAEKAFDEVAERAVRIIQGGLDEL